MNNKPLVSMLIPAYNHERYIEQCILSIWEQDYPNIEIVVINDGSKDKTGELLDNMCQNSPITMKVIHQANIGLCKTLNKLSSLASGKYIIVLASDDELYPGRITNHIEFLESVRPKEVAGCYGQQQVIDENGQVIKKLVFRNMEFENQHAAFLSGNMIFNLQSSTFFADIFKQYKFDESLAFEDWDFFLRLTIDYKLAYLPGVSFRYRGHDEGLNRNMSKIAKARLAVYSKFKDAPSVVTFGTSKFLSSIHILNAKGFFNIRDYKNARKSTLKAFFADFFVFKREYKFIYKPFLGRGLISLFRKAKRFVNG